MRYIKARKCSLICFQLESKVQNQFHVHEAEKLYIQEVLNIYLIAHRIIM